jgi:hypothetical protein
MAAQDLTQLATLKNWLPITSTNTNDDATLSRLITAVSMDFARATRRPDLLLADYVEVHQGDGASRLIAFHWPIVAVTALTVGGVAVVASADKIANGYYLDQDIDPERIWNVYLNGYVFSDSAPISLAYSAGYVQPGGTVGTGQIALPQDIEQAVCDWCGYRYKERPNVGVTQRKSVQGEQESTELLDAPPNVLQVIERYKRELPSLDRRAEERAERMARPAFRQQGKKGK